MAKLRLLTSVAVMVAMLMAALPATAFAHDDDGPSSIYLALGDSVPAGVGASKAKKGYVPLANKKAFEMDLLNLAISGETSGSFIGSFFADGGGQLGAAFSAILDPATDTEVVTLDVGANDLLGLLDSEPSCDPSGAFDLDACRFALGGVLVTFGGNYGTILGTLDAAMGASGDSATIMVVTTYNPFDGTAVTAAPLDELDELADLALLGGDGVLTTSCLFPGLNFPGLNDIIACTGSAFGATVVDVHPLFDGKALKLTHIADGDPHPNDKGHKKIAELIDGIWDDLDDDGDEDEDDDEDDD